jgi:hypothetical protein
MTVKEKKYCVNYDGHWIQSSNNQKWTYKTFFTNSIDEAVNFWKKATAPKMIRENLGRCWCTLNPDQIRRILAEMQQEFDFS